ncbi:MAG: hypothetical protein EBR54_09690 [Flavobacteriia bacterium]|nr:hypothetical protein [Flavobacteriia bacterium]
MKRSYIFSFLLGTFLIAACGSHNLSLSRRTSYSSPKVVTDSTQEEGYNPYQRAFAYYLLSLPPKERASWESSTFTEEEMNAIQDSLTKRFK